MWIPNNITVVCTSLAAGAGLLTLLKDYLGGPTMPKKIRADGKVVIVTGANTGIGREVTRELAMRGAKVFMACRDMEKCEESRRDIVLKSENKYVYCRPCDLASLESVRKFVEQFKREEPKLDVLICNAGVMRCPKSKTKDGFETQLGVNHLGHFLLTNLLLDHLKEATPSRVVVVSSRAHKNGKINKEDLNLEKNYDEAQAYYQSKLANVLFTNELALRLLGTGVVANAVHPGIVDTQLTRHLKVVNGFLGYLAYPFFWGFIRTPAFGAQTVLYAAIHPDVDKVSGQYFYNMEPHEVSETAKDMDLARWLWAVSEKWTHLDYNKAV